ncbi:MAG: hypothetical protein KY475_02815 [Planctomycetes bacterium]|nr:hypothetical protein [Planctomycetota bacterium]
MAGPSEKQYAVDDVAFVRVFGQDRVDRIRRLNRRLTKHDEIGEELTRAMFVEALGGGAAAAKCLSRFVWVSQRQWRRWKEETDKQWLAQMVRDHWEWLEKSLRSGHKITDPAYGFEDLCSVAFDELWKKRARHRNESVEAIRQFLLVVAVRKLRSIHDRRQKWMSNKPILDDACQVTNDDIERQMRRLVKTLNRLKGAVRKVAKKVIVGGKTLKQIAEDLQLPYITVWRLWKEGKALLRESLASDDDA